MNRTVMKWVKKIVYIVAAIILLSVCVNMFLGPHSIAAGGLTGLAIILEEMLNMDRSLVILIGNGGLLVVTFIFLGKEVFFNTLIGAGLLPVGVGLIPKIELISDPMLSMVVGSVLFGVGVAILYHNNASSGGTAVPPLIFKKFFNLNTSIGLFFSDGVVVLLSLLVFSVDAFFYAVSSIFITSVTMSYIENGMNKKKMVYIISNMYTAISNEVMKELGRGVTIIPIIGAYEKSKRDMLMVTCDKKDYQKLILIVNKYDEEAFMITDTVSDVHGKGFSYQSGTV